MENEIKFLLSFKGNKQQLHSQLKKWCKAEGQSINITVLSLIKKHLKKNS